MAQFNIGQGDNGFGQDGLALVGDLLNLTSGLFGNGGTNNSASSASNSATSTSQQGKAQAVGVEQMLQQMIEQIVTQATSTTNDSSTTNVQGNTKQSSQGGSTNNTNQNTSGNTNTAQVSNTDSISAGTVTKGTEQSNALIAQLLDTLNSQLSGAGAGYSKEDAINDSKSSVTAAINQILNSGIGSVLSTDTSSGAYDSTTQAGLANDLAAKAAAAGASVQQKAIGDYASIQVTQKDQAVKNLISTIQQAADGNISTTQNATEQGTLNQDVAATENTTTNQTGTTFEDLLTTENSTSNNSGTSTTSESTSSTQESLQEASNSSNQIELQEQAGTSNTSTSQRGTARQEEDNFWEGIF